MRIIGGQRPCTTGLERCGSPILENRGWLILAVAERRPGPSKITRTEFDDLLESLFSKTMGWLIRDIGELAKLSEEEREQLQEALSKRNWLAHRYFWERARVFLSESGRVSMIQELQEAVDSFGALDQLLTSRTMEWAEPMGITEQMVEREMERLLRSGDEL